METLTPMFPAMDESVIQALLEANDNNIGITIEQLLQMSSDTPVASPTPKKVFKV